MNKQTIIRYLKGELACEEKEALFDWVETSRSNRRYFNSVKNLWAVSGQGVGVEVHPDFADLLVRMNGNVQKSSKRSGILRYATWVAAALFIPAAAGLIWLASERSAFQPLEQADYPTVTQYTPLCARSQITLPDGTEVWLNSGSRLSYPRYFSGSERRVELDGEAYFSVTTNKSHPFVVKTPSDLNVLVTGTAFNICAYSDDGNAELTLVSGSVELRMSAMEEHVKMEPNQQTRYNVESGGYEVRTDVDTYFYTSWKEGVLAFENATMTDLARRIERWYGVKIIVQDTRILELTYTGRFRDENIVEVLELMRETSKVDYRIEDGHVYLSLRE